MNCPANQTVHFLLLTQRKSGGNIMGPLIGGLNTGRKERGVIYVKKDY